MFFVFLCFLFQNLCFYNYGLRLVCSKPPLVAQKKRVLIELSRIRSTAFGACWQMMNERADFHVELSSVVRLRPLRMTTDGSGLDRPTVACDLCHT